MFLTIHATSAIVIGQAITNPIGAFLAGLASHYVLDAIPHGDEKKLDGLSLANMSWIATLDQTILLVNFLFLLVLVNAILMIFNLIPIPPLDGSKVLFSLLPDKYNEFKAKFSINGPIILIGFILLDSLLNLGIFSRLFNFVIEFIILILG